MAYGVGAALRHERTRNNLTLAQISAQTRISERFLSAIEEEQFDRLPGIVFTRNFVRQYALAIDLDPEPLLAQLPKVDVPDTPMLSAAARAREPLWDPRWNSLISSAAWLVFAVGAAVAAYVHFNRPVATRADNAKPAVQAAAPAAPAAPAPVQAAPKPVPPPAAPPAHAVEVSLTAHEECWLQVTADGKIAFTATMQPNETRTVSADDQVKVVTGNAGGLAITLNGKPLDSLGPSGQVRTVSLTAEGPRLIPKTPPPQPPPDPL